VDLLARVDLLIQKKRLAEWIEQIEQVLLLIAQTIEDHFSQNLDSELSFSQLAQSFGEYLQLSPLALKDLVFAARFHDIGTLAIPDAIMLKKGELTEAEKELVKQHVLVGEKIFQPLSSRRDVGRIIRHHHERWDGTGYPDGLVGEDIPWLAQIFQILDIYDALTSNRSYKDAVSSENALAILKQEVERGWRNPDLVAKFADFITHQTTNNL
jgi:putative two-component system response regulator